MSAERSYWVGALKELVASHPDELDEHLWDRLNRVWASYGTDQWLPVEWDEFLRWRAEVSA